MSSGNGAAGKKVKPVPDPAPAVVGSSAAAAAVGGLVPRPTRTSRQAVRRAVASTVAPSAASSVPSATARHHSTSGVVDDDAGNASGVTDGRLPLVILLVGISGSGKSTWAQRYHAGRVGPSTSSTSAALPVTVVSSDRLRRLLTGSVNDLSCDRDVFAMVEDRVRRGVRAGHTVVVDATNTATSFRRKFAATLPPRCRRRAKVFRVAVDEAHRRIVADVAAGMDRAATPVEVLWRQHEQFTASIPLLAAEGWAPLGDDDDDDDDDAQVSA